MATAVGATNTNKVKIAKRVIEVLEFFDAHGRPASVMDVARRYDRPQSSTSELLCSLVDMGLLYRDPQSRCFSPTPRLAALGNAAQPAAIRNGSLFNYMQQLAQTVRQPVALFGRVDTQAQIFQWTAGPTTSSEHLACGASAALCESAAGHLLLAMLPADLSRGLLWRLNAEAAEGAKLDQAAITARLTGLRQSGCVSGIAGFLPGHQVTAITLPRDLSDRPLVLGILYPDAEGGMAAALEETLKHGVRQLFGGAGDEIAATASAFLRAV